MERVCWFVGMIVNPLDGCYFEELRICKIEKVE